MTDADPRREAERDARTVEEALAKRRPALGPWRYAPVSGDSRGEEAWTDHNVLDAEGNELACPPDEWTARLMAAAPTLLEACEQAYRSARVVHGDGSPLCLKLKNAIDGAK